MKCKPRKSGVKVGELFKAVKKANLRGVTKCLSGGVDPDVRNARGQTPLYVAAEKGDTGIVAHLLKKGADPNVRDACTGLTPLHWAAGNGYASIVAHLLKKGAKVNARDDYDNIPLHWAASGGHAAVVTLLLGRGADPVIKDKNEDTPTPLDLILEQARSSKEKEFLDLADRLKKSHPEQVVDWWMRAEAAT